ncbi:hypothetical protein [Dehalogenimonas etheniformans]|uniref:Uncharacterized protein n=1 Tax=Dehalogenimonas etheniformans TaxID=1536648 RepID=A0A2P5P7X6_9CHLR|nr:hypothetical protein [Dehalogenimonas etheniformans]PPD58397.1 hypothetical protein JP09_004640 [Dehalogenimonas etheniformans]QNT76971.1 hypothetical protein HX448_09940 [Dehalogenimonas etheniformans]
METDNSTFLECPSEELWESRRQWFETLSESTAGEAAYVVSEQACALIGEVQTAFCAGVWVAVVLLAMAVVDSQLRETELPDYKGNTKDLLSIVGANEALQGLRIRRNSFVHVDPKNPAITVDQQWNDRQKLENEAREAVKLMFEAFYLGSWV